ncbi:MAG: phosphoribosylaminoimidazolesuccinocarboxamide synthase [Bacteroidetes bacterium]|nr:phosphoribosylaminoimidazolesuccinocarboxamide synthase [Bacteroidota bacterium]
MEVNIKKLEKAQLFHDGKTKKLYTTNHPEFLFVEFKNEVFPMEGKKSTKVRGKSAINLEVASYIFQFLDSYHIPTHFMGKVGGKYMVVRRLEMVPIHVIIRNAAAGSFSKSFRMEDGQILPAPIIEFYFKNAKLGYPMVNEYHLYAFGSSNQDEIRNIQRYSAKINAVMKNFFERRNFQLIDFKLEFGRSGGKIYVADEITLDTCRLWDQTDDRHLEKITAGKKETEISKLYAEIRQRILHPRTKDEKLNLVR